MDLLEKASIILTPTAYNNGEALCVKPSDGSGDFDFSRNSAATRVNAQGLVENVQILSSNLVQNGDFSELGSEEVSNGSFSQEGVELITNGSFDTDSDWNKGTGWTISGGKANATSSPSGRRLSQFNLGQTINRPYKINLNVSNLTEGGFSVWFGGVQSQAISSDGDYTIYLTPTSTAQLFIFTNGTTTGSIDNVSVKEVGQDWDTSIGDATIGDNVAIFPTSTNSFLIQVNVVDLSVKTYKLQYEVVTTNGSNFRLSGGNSAFGTVNLDSATIGVKTVYLTSNGTKRNLQINNNNFIGSVTNISVKEVDPNDYWTLGTGWSIGDGVAISDATQGYINQNNLGGAGVTATYKVQWTQNITAGTRLRFFARNYNDGGNATIISITRDDGLVIGGGNCIGNGTFTAYVSSTNGYSFKLLAEAGVEADISNVTTIQITDDTNLPRISYENFSYQDALGSEEIVNGDFENDLTNWSKFGTTSAIGGIATIGASSSSGIFQTILTNGSTYSVTINVVSYDGVGTAEITNNNGVNIYTITTTGEQTFTFTHSISSGKLVIRGISNALFSLSNVSVKEVLGQEVVPDSGCGSWLFEPQSTNLFDYSEDFSDSFWTKDVAKISSNSIISPDGTQNASTLVSSNTTSPQLIKGSFSVISGDDYSVSVFAKKKDFDYIQIRFEGRGAPFQAGGVWFNIDNGTLGTQETGYTGTITDYGNGWYRCTSTATATSSATATIRIALASSDNSSTIVGNGTDGTYIWGAQAEALSYPTSYIPTSGSTVTRNQDVCTNGGSLATINSTEGTLYFEGAALTDSGSNRSISISDGTNTNQIVLRFSNSANQITAYITDGGTITASLNNTLSNALNYNKIALKYKLNDVALWVNGVEVATDTNATMPSGFDVLKFSRADGANNFFAKTKALVVYKEALSDEELIELTTI